MASGSARRRRSWRPTRVWPTCVWPFAAVLMMLAVAGCGDTAEDSTAETPAAFPVATADDALAPPGTPLGPDVDVLDGSYLVGSVFPVVDFYTDADEQVPKGWQALLVVDGDPVEVWNDYMKALEVDDGDAVESCVVSAVAPPSDPPQEPPPSPEQRFLTEDRLDGENRITCRFLTDTVSVDMSVGAERCWREGFVQCPLIPIAHLRIEVLDEPEYPSDLVFRGADQLRYERGGEEMVAVPEGSVTAPELDLSGESLLPEPGDRLDAELDHFLDGNPAPVVPDGARSLVTPAMVIDCNSGLVAVLEVPGTPSEALSLFDGISRDPMSPIVTGSDPDGAAWAGGVVSETGGAQIDLVALATGEDASLVTITECGD